VERKTKAKGDPALESKDRSRFTYMRGGGRGLTRESV